MTKTGTVVWLETFLVISSISQNWHIPKRRSITGVSTQYSCRILNSTTTWSHITDLSIHTTYISWSPRTGGICSIRHEVHHRKYKDATDDFEHIFYHHSKNYQLKVFILIYFHNKMSSVFYFYLYSIKRCETSHLSYLWEHIFRVVVIYFLYTSNALVNSLAPGGSAFHNEGLYSINTAAPSKISFLLCILSAFSLLDAA